MNLYHRLAYLAQYQPAKIAVERASERITYGDLDLLARRIAGRLRAAGVGRDDAVGLRLRDTPEHVAALFAVMRLGAIILPLDWRGTRNEFDALTGRFQAKAVLDDETPALDWSPVLIGLADIRKAEPDSAPPADINDSPMGFSLTSGTTGTPKAMVVTHEQLHARFATRALERVFDRDDRFLATLPVAYPAGREHAICLIMLGATLVMFPSLFEPRELVDFVNSRDITAVSLSPNMSRALLAMKRVEGGHLMPRLRTVVSTTGKLQPEERVAIRQHISNRLIDYYGSTGTGPIAIIDREADGVDSTAVGRPVLGMEVEIVDDAGRSLAAGEVGRIRVRGPAVTTRAVGETGAEDEGFRGGWYYPGDLGNFGPGGLIHLQGRTADLIKRGGLMIHAQEVEQVLRRHESVVDAAVVGIPHPELGQEVAAFVVIRSPVEVKDIIRHCRRELTAFKVPTQIKFVEALPRNPGGKVLKAQLL